MLFVFTHCVIIRSPWRGIVARREVVVGAGIGVLVEQAREERGG